MNKLCIEPGCDKERKRRYRRCAEHVWMKRPHADKVCPCGRTFRVEARRRGKFCSPACAAKSKRDRKPWSKPHSKAKCAKRATLKRLDQLAGKLCRSEGKCAARGFDGIECSTQMNWAHIISRSYIRIRYWRSNCLCLCSAHHVFYTFHPAHWERFRDGEGHGASEATLRLRKFALDPFAPKLDREATYAALSAGVWPREDDDA